MVVGDVNIWMDDVTSSTTVQLLDILASFDLQQLVSTPTHKKQYTLDIVDLNTSILPISSPIVQDLTISDHALIKFSVKAQHQGLHNQFLLCEISIC